MNVSKLNRLTVSRETVLRLSRLLLGGEPWTRRALSESLGISTVTVGKMAEEWKRAGLLEETVLPAERGRSPRQLHLTTQSVAWGILRMEERGCSLAVVSPGGSLISRQSLPYDTAMSPEGNEAMLRGQWHTMKHRLEKTYCVVGLGVILRESRLCYRERAILEGIGSEADRTAREEALTARALSHGAYGKTVLYLQPDREIRSLLVMGKEWKEGRVPAKGQDRFDAVIEAVFQMAKLILPDGIVAESHGRHEGDGRRLLRRLEKRWLEGVPTPCPQLFPPEELTLAERAMIRELNEALAQTIAREMGR